MPRNAAPDGSARPARATPRGAPFRALVRGAPRSWPRRWPTEPSFACRDRVGVPNAAARPGRPCARGVGAGGRRRRRSLTNTCPDAFAPYRAAFGSGRPRSWAAGSRAARRRAGPSGATTTARCARPRPARPRPRRGRPRPARPLAPAGAGADPQPVRQRAAPGLGRLGGAGQARAGGRVGANPGGGGAAAPPVQRAHRPSLMSQSDRCYSGRALTMELCAGYVRACRMDGPSRGSLDTMRTRRRRFGR